MLTSGHKKYLRNPTLGLVPFLVFVVSFYLTRELERVLIFSLLFSLIFEAFLRFYGQSKISSLTVGVSFSALFLTLLTRIIFFNVIDSKVVYILICEIYLVIILMVIRIFENRIKNSYYWSVKHLAQRPFLTDFFQTAFFMQYALTIHLFYMLIFLFLTKQNTEPSDINIVSYIFLPILCSVATIIFEGFNIKKISKKLRQEEWLPIVDNKGSVTGRIAKSETIKLKNRFMHPVVRIALILNEEIYLQSRDESSIIDIGYLDNPFEKYVLYNNEIGPTANEIVNSIIEKGEKSTTSLKFIIKYVFKNDETKKLIFLYALKLESEDQLVNNGLLQGRFWSRKQIEGYITKDNIFSECFQLEYEYMKNTILLTDNIKQPSLLN